MIYTELSYFILPVLVFSPKELKVSPYQNIICLTEEAAEVLYLLDLGHLISAVSVYAKRPSEVLTKPKVCHFINANFEEIDQLRPDLIIGFSDLQQDIAKELIARGKNVWISNHRSLKDILLYIQALANLVGAAERGTQLVQRLEQKIADTKKIVESFTYRPKVYFEEWDGPYFTAIQWVSEIIELCGGENIFRDRSKGILAKDRIVTDKEIIGANPELIFCCWCGKKANIPSLKMRPGWEGNIAAFQQDRIYELPPEIMLQPGPAPILDGIDIILTQIKAFQA